MDRVCGLLLDAVAGRDEPLLELGIFSFFAAARVEGAVGLASTLRRHEPGRRGFPVRRAGDLLPARARELAAELLPSENLLEAAAGLAALNALLNAPRELPDFNAGELLARWGRGRRVVVVGDFPFTRELRGLAGELRVFDLGRGPGEGRSPQSALDAALESAEVAGITSTAILNHSLGHILECLPRACRTVLVGPSTPLSPALFELGVDVLCGTVVDDHGRAWRDLLQGATFRQLRGIRHVSLARPGLGLSPGAGG